MASPSQYRSQIKNLGLDNLEMTASSIAEAKNAIKRTRNLQKMLRQIKQNINLDMKTIRANYRQKMSTAASTSSTIVTILGKRKLAGQMRASEKRRLRMERDRTLQPYESIKLMIDDLLIQMDSAKAQFQAFIEEIKSEEQLTKQSTSAKKTVAGANTSTNFCPQCGTLATESDRFCRNCGNRL
ncbi:MAG: hypothetical protein DRP09_19470 [Candidatus Thorarchaeota archaeon]|nr:MAG: hypothetical protein DRP09_19470 [Candidatus Thorarchaeota archaeon]